MGGRGRGGREGGRQGSERRKNSLSRVLCSNQFSLSSRAELGRMDRRQVSHLGKLERSNKRAAAQSPPADTEEQRDDFLTLTSAPFRCVRWWTPPVCAASPPPWWQNTIPVWTQWSMRTSLASSSTTSRRCWSTTTPTFSITPTLTLSPSATLVCWSRSLAHPLFWR